MNEILSQQSVFVAKGNIYMPLEVYEKYLRHVRSVALLKHDEGVLLLPLVQDSAGGLLLKIRNLHGDRVLSAQEFFRANGFGEMDSGMSCNVTWITERGGLFISMQSATA